MERDKKDKRNPKINWKQEERVPRDMQTHQGIPKLFFSKIEVQQQQQQLENKDEFVDKAANHSS